MRAQMPRAAAQVDALRARLGPESVNAALREAVAGAPGRFYARENGFEVGTPWMQAEVAQVEAVFGPVAGVLMLGTDLAGGQ